MTAITKDNVLDLLEQAVAERGADYIDPKADGGSCTYVDWDGDDPKPGCIVGLALAKAGYDIDMLDLWDHEVTGISVAATPKEITMKTGVEIDQTALSAFRIAQDRQDGGSDWGDALQRAKDFMARFAGEEKADDASGA